MLCSRRAASQTFLNGLDRVVVNPTSSVPSSTSCIQSILHPGPPLIKVLSQTRSISIVQTDRDGQQYYLLYESHLMAQLTSTSWILPEWACSRRAPSLEERECGFLHNNQTFSAHFLDQEHQK